MHAATTNTTMQPITNNSTLRDLSSWRARIKSPMLDGGQGKKNSVCMSTLPSGPAQTVRQHLPTLRNYRSITASPGHSARPPLTDTTAEARLAAPKSAGALPADPINSVGLAPPTLNSMTRVTGATTPRHRIENKRRRKAQQRLQPDQEWWTTHRGHFELPPQLSMPPTYRNKMCPSGLALHHPAAATLLEYATNGCPALTGKPWTRDQMQAAIDRGPHVSALVPDAMTQLDAELEEKLARNQCRLV